MISKLQYISQQTTTLSHLDAIQYALESGCQWIQLRIKNEPASAVLPQAIASKKLCDSYGARLIINDFPEIAKAVNAYGVHLGLKDMPVPEARRIVGDQLIIGGTANTFEDIRQRYLEGVNYVGVGPFRFTTTKEKLSPILGLEGYKRIVERMEEERINIPIIAVGGILPEDIEALLQTGVYGVAISGALTQAANKQAMVEKMNQLMYKRVNL